MIDSKAIVNMTNWELYVYHEQYSLSGIADNHPALGRNTYVSRTSSLVSYTYENEILTYETRNTIYVCPLKYMNADPFRNVIASYKEELTKRSEKSDSPLDKIIEVAARIAVIRDLEQPKEGRWNRSNEGDYTIENPECFRNDFVTYVMAIQEKGKQEILAAEETSNAKLIEAAERYEDCVYMEVSNVSCGSKLAFHIGEHTGVIEPRLHVGMFQDSVLYMKYRDKEDDFALDFRYFPKGFGDVMKTYSWSDNIVRAVIKNDCSYGIEFNGESIDVGETKIFTSKTHSQGLISPDCYNGKSVFNISKESDEE